MVGRSGATARRLAVLIPSARTVPARTCGSAVIGVSKNAATSPVITACCAWGTPRYGMCVIFTPAVVRKSSVKASDADGCVIELLLARQIDQFLDRLRRRRIGYQQDLADPGHHGNGDEILLAVIRQAGIERWIGRMAGECHQQGV